MAHKLLTDIEVQGEGLFNGNLTLGTASTFSKLVFDTGGFDVGEIEVGSFQAMSVDAQDGVFSLMSNSSNQNHAIEGTMGGYVTLNYNGVKKLQTASTGVNITGLLYVSADARVVGAFRDTGNSPGTSGQVLSSTVTGTSWITPASGNVSGTGTTNNMTKWSNTTGGLADALMTDNGSTVTLSTNGSANTFDLFHTSGSGVALNIEKGGNNEGLIVNKTSGSGNAVSITGDSYFNGDVGIGTASPDYKLEVDGTLGVSRTDGIIFAGSVASGQGNKITSDTSNNLIFSTSLPSAPYTTTEKVRILNNGNVGIGITNPATKLHIGSTSTGGSTTEEFRIQTSTSGGYGGDAILNLVTGQYGNSGIYFGDDAAYASQPAHIRFVDVSNYMAYDSIGNHIFTYSGSEIFRTTGTNIGMGVTGTPVAKLDINTSGTALNVYSSQSTGIKVRGGGSFQDIAQFYNVSNVAAMTLDSAGQLGIGTSDPQAELHVQSMTNGTPTIRLNHNSSYPSWMIEATANNTASPPTGQLRWDANPGATGMELIYWSSYSKNSLKLDGVNFIVTTGGSEKMRIDTTGDVGIGVTNPAEKLEVDGAVKATEYKGYLPAFQHGGFYHSSSASSGTTYWIPTNYISETTSSQYYNNWVAPYNGRVKKIVMRYASGTTPTATSVTFKKSINGAGDLSSYPATIANAASTNMTATRVFGSTDIAFNEGDRVRIGFTTNGGTRLLYGFAYTIVLEYDKD